MSFVAVVLLISSPYCQPEPFSFPRFEEVTESFELSTEMNLESLKGLSQYLKPASSPQAEVIEGLGTKIVRWAIKAKKRDSLNELSNATLLEYLTEIESIYFELVRPQTKMVRVTRTVQVSFARIQAIIVDILYQRAITDGDDILKAELKRRRWGSSYRTALSLNPKIESERYGHTAGIEGAIKGLQDFESSILKDPSFSDLMTKVYSFLPQTKHELLASDAATLIYTASKSADKISEDIESALLQGLSAHRGETRRAVYMALGSFGRQARDIELLADANWRKYVMRTHWGAAPALARILGSKVLPELVEAKAELDHALAEADLGKVVMPGESLKTLMKDPNFVMTEEMYKIDEKKSLAKELNEAIRIAEALSFLEMFESTQSLDLVASEIQNLQDAKELSGDLPAPVVVALKKFVAARTASKARTPAKDLATEFVVAEAVSSLQTISTANAGYMVHDLGDWLLVPRLANALTDRQKSLIKDHLRSTLKAIGGSDADFYLELDQ